MNTVQKDGRDSEVVKIDLETVKKLEAVLGEITEKSLHVFNQYLENTEEEDGFRIMHPAIVSRAFQDMAIKALEHPAEIVKEQMNYWNSMAELWQRGMAKFLLNKEFEPVATPAPADRRFKDEAWAENVVFDCIKQCYLLSARHLQSAVNQVHGLDEHTTKKVQFYTRQFIDAMSPTNFAATNPEVLKATIESKGENLLEGVAHMLQDLDRNKGNFNVKMTNLEHFHIGENIATTPGKVIYQNEMMQLLQYTPSTETVRQRPLLIVPAWINRFYILDLQPKNSFVKWAVDQGHTVFLISWVNPDESYAEKTFDEYLLKGPIAALDAIELATGEKEVNAVGYCIGGTLLGITAAYMAAKRDNRIISCTYFTSMLDFSEPGEIGVFIDEAQIDLLDKHMRFKGYLEGHHLAEAFSMLRENDLIWSFFVKDYLLGQEPMPFDILYWNSDSTNMPAAMHSFYVRNMYLYNRLREPNGITLAGEGIDLRRITIPQYFLSASEDHIAPWKSTYAGTQLVSGPVRFVLGGSGHIAGVMNPPAAKKYCYWTNNKIAATPDEWIAEAERHEGSWWKDWDQWVGQFAGNSVPARQPGDSALKPIEDAPGSYVRVRPNSSGHVYNVELTRVAVARCSSKAEAVQAAIKEFEKERKAAGWDVVADGYDVLERGPKPLQTERVRQRAHELWEQEGRPEGRQDEHWARACRELQMEEQDSFVENTGVAEQEKPIPIIPAEQAEKASAPFNEEVKGTNEGVEDTTMWKSQDKEPEKQIKIVLADEKPDPLGRKIGSLPLNKMKAGYDYALGTGGKRRA